MAASTEGATVNTRQSPYLPESPPHPHHSRPRADPDASRHSELRGTPLQLLGRSRSIDQSAATSAILAEVQEEGEAERSQWRRRRDSLGEDSVLPAVPENSVLGSPPSSPTRGSDTPFTRRGAASGALDSSAGSGAGGGAPTSSGTTFNGRSGGFNAAVGRVGGSYGPKSQGPASSYRGNTSFSSQASRSGSSAGNSDQMARWRAKYQPRG